HTRFDCDWSSDVCSSDLAVALACLSAIGIVALLAGARAEDRMPPLPMAKYNEVQRKALVEFAKEGRQPVSGPFVPLLRSPELMRSEERRVGKECRGRDSA